MIVYSPLNGEVLTNVITYYPNTAFIMTQLGEPVPEELKHIRKEVLKELGKYCFTEKDASSLVTGGDFLDKSWKIILGVPLGIAVLTNDMKPATVANVFYELGLMDALGKETLIVKARDYQVPSDFKRTEYLNFGNNFSVEFGKFMTNIQEREGHYWAMAEAMQADPVLAIDYIRRAFLLNPSKEYMDEAKIIYAEHDEQIDDQSKIHIRNFLRLKAG